MSHYFFPSFLNQSIYLMILMVKMFFSGAIGRVHPEGKDGLGTRIFSAYIGGTRPLKRISEHLYQPRRPAVRVKISFLYTSFIFYPFISFCLSFSSLLVDFTSFHWHSQSSNYLIHYSFRRSWFSPSLIHLLNYTRQQVISYFKKTSNFFQWTYVLYRARTRTWFQRKERRNFWLCVRKLSSTLIWMWVAY